MSDSVDEKLSGPQTGATEAKDRHETLEDSVSQVPVETLDELRDLMLGQTVGDRVDERLSTFRVHAENIADVLPEAVRLAESQDLVPAVRTTVEDAIKDSVTQEQEILSEALFPIIGPATRKAVTTAIKTLADSLNQGLELSLSPKSIGWRFESWRTGRPFAEVVLLRTLLYQVEQVLLIHKETGLMLNDVVAETVTVQDPDLVSSMLTAIEDFVKDSFTTNSDSYLDSVEFGDLTLWIEEGPQVVIACAIRGVAPKRMRIQMQETLENIHRQYDSQLENFSGDRAPFDSTESYLRACLISQSKNLEQKRSPLLWIGSILLIALVLFLARAAYVQYQWQSAIRTLDYEPGIAVLRDRRGWFRGYIKGLQDPLAPQPETILQSRGIDVDKVVFDIEPYWSLSPKLIVKHAQQQLAPSPHVEIQYQPNSLTLSAMGSASHDWVKQAQQFVSDQPRIAQLDVSNLQISESEKLLELKAKLEQATLPFQEGVSTLDSQSQNAFKELAPLANSLTTLADRIQQPLVIYVVGQTSASGTDEDNAQLSQSRADLIVRRLTQVGIPGKFLVAEGIGVRSNEPSTVQKAQVSFRVELIQP